ncbi:MAG: hypothetical protein EBY39_06610 [Flavobacteriia bacterium]|nr:hypothetical protein [Flavobacteriia bacterium]
MVLNWLDIFIAGWMATWIIAQFTVFIPSMLVLKHNDSEHNSLSWWPLTWVIFGIGSLIAVPVFLPIVLIDRYRRKFISAYVSSLLEVDNER